MQIIKKQAGFTLIEMMIVLLVISVLLIITIPNVTKNNSTINEKGCEAFVRMVEGQVQAFQLEFPDETPTVENLFNKGYLKSAETKCPDGKLIVIKADGTVTCE